MNQRQNRSGVKLTSYPGKTASKFNKTLDLHFSDGSLDLMRCALKPVVMTISWPPLVHTCPHPIISFLNHQHFNLIDLISASHPNHRNIGERHQSQTAIFAIGTGADHQF